MNKVIVRDPNFSKRRLVVEPRINCVGSEYILVRWQIIHAGEWQNMEVPDLRIVPEMASELAEALLAVVSEVEVI